MDMIIGTLILLVMMVGSFIAGVKLSDYYADRQDTAVNYALKKQFARLQAGVDADDTAQPYVSPDEQDQVYRRYEIPQEFVDQLQISGQATMKLQ